MPKKLVAGGRGRGGERVAGESKNGGGGLSVKQRKHVTPALAPICASPGITWPGRAGIPAHSLEPSRAAPPLALLPI